MAKTKSRWSETAEGRYFFIDDHGEIVGKVIRNYDWTYVYKDKEARMREFVSLEAAKNFVEKDVGAL